MIGGFAPLRKDRRSNDLRANSLRSRTGNQCERSGIVRARTARKSSAARKCTSVTARDLMKAEAHTRLFRATRTSSILGPSAHRRTELAEAVRSRGTDIGLHEASSMRLRNGATAAESVRGRASRDDTFILRGRRAESCGTARRDFTGLCVVPVTSDRSRLS